MTRTMDCPGGPAYHGSGQRQAEHTATAEESLTRLQAGLGPRTDHPPMRIPLLRTTQIPSEFSHADIADLVAFRRLGKRAGAFTNGPAR